MLLHCYTLPPMFEPDMTATFATSSAKIARDFPPFAANAADVANVAGLAGAKSNLAPRDRATSVMFLPCAAIPSPSAQGKKAAEN